MKKISTLALAFLFGGMLAACGNAAEENRTEQKTESIPDTSGSETEQTDKTDQTALVAYFAYSENMGDTSGMDVDAISSASLNRDTDNTEGNLQVMAQIIEEDTNADMFHILVEKPYQNDYKTMLPEAVRQLQNKDWPALKEKVENLSEYNVIYLGMPVWDSEIPPALHTFLSENDLSGKTIVPFGIHLGSGFGGMLNEIEELAPDATLAEGFTINAATANDEVKTEFRAWLEEQDGGV